MKEVILHVKSQWPPLAHDKAPPSELLYHSSNCEACNNCCRVRGATARLLADVSTVLVNDASILFISLNGSNEVLTQQITVCK